MIYVPSREIVLPGERCRRCGKPSRRPEFPLRRPRMPRRQRAPLRLSGDNVQVNSSNAVNISLGGALNVGGAGDACCCECTECASTGTPSSYTLTFGAMTNNGCPFASDITISTDVSGFSYTLPKGDLPLFPFTFCTFTYYESPASSVAFTAYNGSGCSGGAISPQPTWDLGITVQLFGTTGIGVYAYIRDPSNGFRHVWWDDDTKSRSGSNRCDATINLDGVGGGVITGPATLTPNT